MFRLSFLTTSFLLGGLTLAVASSQADAAVAAIRQCGDPRKAAPFYRSFNSASMDHLFTRSRNEWQNSLSLGYANNGIAGYIFSSSQPGTVALYRLYNSNNTDHFYTTDEQEVADAVQNLGYKSEGISGYVYRTAACGGVPLYRLFNAMDIDHVYTTSISERNNLASGVGYSFDGIAGYVFPY